MEKLFELFYKSINGVSTDTRTIKKGSLFISLKGDNFNGNKFAKKAIENGAKYAIVDEEVYSDEGNNIYLVEDCLIFLQKLANKHRNKFNIPILGITGSNGKTSTKELIKEVLSTKFNVLATKGNLNNHIGVPLTLLELNDQHEIAIIEMGANKPLDIQELCEIAEPNYGIITNIGKAHLEGFINFEGVIKTKTELYQSVLTKEGVLIVNNEDQILQKNLPKTIKRIQYGSDIGADVKGELLNLSPYIELKWSYNEYTSPPIKTNMLGKYNYFNFLAAISAGILFDVENESINKAISNYTPNNNRSQIKETIKNTLILDCYNANPTSMLSALESFFMIENDSKNVIIGDMLELGEEALKEHEKILTLLNNNDISYYTVGNIFNECQSNKAIKAVINTSELSEYLKKNEIKGKLILLKGSRSISLEKLDKVL
jgi:UDP-N-acetylmuramoyl-tripeptide--D-alanyl-D-alanine ligase